MENMSSGIEQKYGPSVLDNVHASDERFNKNDRDEQDFVSWGDGARNPYKRELGHR